MHMTANISPCGMLGLVLETGQDGALYMIDCCFLCDESFCVSHGRNPWTPVCKGSLVPENIPGLVLALECECN